ncbi:putative transcription factor AP2-EREBP family [Helianthus anomalus]
MTLENTSLSAGNKLLKNKTTKKKEEALRKLSGGVNKKKKKKKKEDDEPEEWWKLGHQTSCSERKKRWKLLGVKKSGTMYFAAIIYPDGRLVRLGTYTSSKLAAMAYDQESLKIYHLQKPLNFPHRVIIWTPEPGITNYQYNNRTNTTTEPIQQLNPVNLTHSKAIFRVLIRLIIIINIYLLFVYLFFPYLWLWLWLWLRVSRHGFEFW